MLPALSIVLAVARHLGGRRCAACWSSVLGDDYITLAEAKGLGRAAHLPRLRHAQRAAAAAHPARAQARALVSGAILVEVIFAYPGVGYRLYLAIGQKDLFVIQGIVLLLSVSIALAMLLLDLIYPLIDPRVTSKGR